MNVGKDVPESQRRDFICMLMSFKILPPLILLKILSEARKYHLNLTVANQFIGQMEEEVKNAVFGSNGHAGFF